MLRKATPLKQKADAAHLTRAVSSKPEICQCPKPIGCIVDGDADLDEPSLSILEDVDGGKSIPIHYHLESG